MLNGVLLEKTRAEAECPCVIRVSVLNETRSGAHKFKAVGVLSGFYVYSAEWVRKDWRLRSLRAR
jgi:IS4 transposase